MLSKYHILYRNRVDVLLRILHGDPLNPLSSSDTDERFLLVLFSSDGSPFHDPLVVLFLFFLHMAKMFLMVLT